jgi:RecA-family ATPase
VQDRLDKLSAFVGQGAIPGEPQAAEPHRWEEAAEALSYLDPDMPYDQWLKTGMSLQGGLGKAGRALWLAWSAQGQKYKPGEPEEKWDSFTRSGVGLGSLFHMAHEAGWDPPDPVLSAEEEFAPYAEPAQALSHALALDRVLNPVRDRFLCGKLFARGKLSVLFGPTHVGKSIFLSQLAFHIAAGCESYAGMELPEGGGPVLVYTAEDDSNDWALKAAAQLAEWTALAGREEAMRRLARALERFHIIDRSGSTTRLSELVKLTSSKNGGTVTRTRALPTEEHAQLLAEAVRLRPLLVDVETASQLVDEEDNPNLAALVARLTAVAQASGAAVVLSHHPTKADSAAGDSSLTAARGGYALVANAKGGVVSLYPADQAELARLDKDGLMAAKEDIAVLRQEKGTPSAKRQAPVTLIRVGTEYGGVFRLPVEVQRDPKAREQHEARAQDARRREQWSLLHVYQAAEEKMKSGPVSKNRLRAPLRELGERGADTDLDALVDRAIAAGVLVVEHADKVGRVLSLTLGRRPSPGPAAPSAAEEFSESAETADPSRPPVEGSLKGGNHAGC